MANRLDGRLDRPVSRDDDHFDGRVDGLGGLEQADPVHARHPDVGDEDIEPALPQLGVRLLAVVDNGHFMARVRQLVPERDRDGALVVGEKHVHCARPYPCPKLRANSVPRHARERGGPLAPRVRPDSSKVVAPVQESRFCVCADREASARRRCSDSSPAVSDSLTVPRETPDWSTLARLAAILTGQAAPRQCSADPTPRR